MANITDSNNAFAGGITYTSPALFFGSGGVGGGFAPNSGLSFDIPLSTVNNMTNNALGFTALNSMSNRDFVGGIYAGAQGSLNQTSGQVISGFNTALQNQSNLAWFQASQAPELMQGMFSTSLGLADAARRITNAANKGACFITTAVCEADNKPDDCDELQTLRAFRDEVMLKTDKGRALVKQYYEEAPSIVEKIKARKDAQTIFNAMRHGYINPAVKAVKDLRMDDAYRIYCDLFAFAQEAAENG